jgi:hypothetical protein
VSPIIEALEVTENGTYEATEGVHGYSPVTVNVAGGANVLPDVVDDVASLEVEIWRDEVHVGEEAYYEQRFVLLNIYPKTNGTVYVTYGGLTKTITDTSGAEEPEPQQVFFGTFCDVTDPVETPEQGMLTISGDYRGYGEGTYTDGKGGTSHYGGINKVNSFGNISMIPPGAFNCCNLASGDTPLDAIVIPNGVKSIGEYAFGSLSRLNMVIFNGNGTKIGEYAFGGCTGLNTVIFNGNEINICGNAFDECSNLSSIIFNGDKIRIEDKGLALSTMSSIEVVALSQIPPVIVGNQPLGAAAIIYVPRVYADAYREAFNGSRYFITEAI